MIDIDWCVFEGIKILGIIVGVLVFEVLINEVIDVFVDCFDVIVEKVVIVEENVEFKVFCVLRVLV